MSWVSPSRRTIAVLLGAAALVGLVAGGGTFALLQDDTGASASVSAATTFDETPPGDRAWDDVDGDLAWDVGEPTYNESELYSFSNSSVDLVIPADVGPVNDSNGVSISANTVVTRVTVDGGTGIVSLEATGGDLVATGQTLRATSSQVVVRASGRAALGGALVRAAFGIDVVGQSVDVNGSLVRSEGFFGTINLSALRGPGGPIDAEGATLDAGTGNVDLNAVGDVQLDDARLEADFLFFPAILGDAVADLGTNGATLHVQNAEIADDDATLVYDPDGITISGIPASGAVSAT